MILFPLPRYRAAVTLTEFMFQKGFLYAGQQTENHERVFSLVKFGRKSNMYIMSSLRSLCIGRCDLNHITREFYSALPFILK